MPLLTLQLPISFLLLFNLCYSAGGCFQKINISATRIIPNIQIPIERGSSLNESAKRPATKQKAITKRIAIALSIRSDYITKYMVNQPSLNLTNLPFETMVHLQ